MCHSSMRSNSIQKPPTGSHSVGGGFENVTLLLALKMEEGTTSQEMQEALAEKDKGTHFP